MASHIAPAWLGRAALAGRTLRDQALALARAGVTSLAEAMRASAQDEAA